MNYTHDDKRNVINNANNIMNNNTTLLPTFAVDDEEYKKRKQRKIYNAYTDIDSVAEPPGPAFRNWIITTKKKLQVWCYIHNLYSMLKRLLFTNDNNGLCFHALTF